VAGAIAVYCTLALTLYGDPNPASSTQLPFGGTGDVAQEVWFLAWPAYALSHATNPLFSTFVNYPHGVNLMDNTSMPTLGILAAPLTLLAGPVAAFNLLLRLGFVVSASAMFLVLRRFTSWLPAAFVGALLYGFSPYMIGQGSVHAFLVFLAFPPIALLLLDELLVRQQRSALRTGGLLGLAAALQLGISAEVLAMSALVAVCCAIVLVARHPLGAAARARHATVGLTSALVAFLLVGGYPLWFYFFGPRHVVGPPHAVSGLSVNRADLLGAVFPTLNEAFGPASLIARGTAYAHGALTEDGSYLGVPLLVVLVLLVVRCRRSGIVQLAALVAVGAYVLSLGDMLVVNDHLTAVELPFQALLHLPVINDLEALRFSLFVAACAAVVLAVGLDRLHSEGLRSPPGRDHSSLHVKEPVAGTVQPVAPAPVRSQSARLHSLLCCGLAVVALLPLFPRQTYRPEPTGIPAFFAGGALSSIPSGSVLLPYPNPFGPYGASAFTNSMGWQAEAGMRFKMIGAYAAIPGPGGAANSGTVALYLPPITMQILFDWALYGPTSGFVPPPFSRTTFSDMRAFCRRWHVATIAVQSIGSAPGELMHYLTAALGRAPKEIGGVDVWLDVAGRLDRSALDRSNATR
jgi:hypothetical protein